MNQDTICLGCPPPTNVSASGFDLNLCAIIDNYYGLYIVNDSLDSCMISCSLTVS